MKEEIKTKARELANKAYWQKYPQKVTIHEIEDPHLELALQEMAEWATAKLQEEVAFTKGQLLASREIVTELKSQLQSAKKELQKPSEGEDR